MDYAIRILKELIKEIQNTPYEDTKYREILQKRGEQVSAPVILRRTYKEICLDEISESACDYPFKVAA